MDQTLTTWAALLVVPLLSIVVLAALLVTSASPRSTFVQRSLGAAGVLFAGPAVMLMLGSAAARAADGSVQSNGPSPPNNKDVSQQVATDDEPSESIDPSTNTDEATPPLDDATVESSSQRSISIPDSTSPLVSTPDRPAWVNSQPQLEGPVHRYSIWSKEQAAPKDCGPALDLALVHQTNSYIDEYLRTDTASHFVNYDLNYIKTHLVDPEKHYSGPVFHKETAEYPQWTMYEEHCVLVFDASFRDELDTQWQDVRVGSRLLFVIVGAFGSLGLLGTICAYFRLDNATRGFYTGRLQFAAVAAILIVIAAGVLVARWIPWI